MIIRYLDPSGKVLGLGFEPLGLVLRKRGFSFEGFGFASYRASGAQGYSRL